MTLPRLPRSRRVLVIDDHQLDGELVGPEEGARRRKQKRVRSSEVGKPAKATRGLAEKSQREASKTSWSWTTIELSPRRRKKHQTRLPTVAQGLCIMPVALASTISTQKGTPSVAIRPENGRGGKEDMKGAVDALKPPLDSSKEMKSRAYRSRAWSEVASTLAKQFSETHQPVFGSLIPSPLTPTPQPKSSLSHAHSVHQSPGRHKHV
ncbi:hypothetical protein GUJ93_ZPchr0004g38105 [Zizania palustris]|uniref:Uncharacterized protein n=1 Tax=Zizania palustris TaxID=103762 RepID=A0A8J5SIW4_ZIZPA|nr:hypothetical protein GUJ93_ZPchr0004g38105 [Zizania palustris]